jgi:hypothetical protein
MVLFLRRKPATPPPSPPGYIPVDMVQRMAASGMDEPDIAARLTNQGFSSNQIDIAMREALKAQISAPPFRQPGPFPQAPPAPEEQEGPEVPATPTMEFPARQPEPPRQMSQPVQQPMQQRPPAYPSPSAMPPRRPLGLMPPAEAMRPRADVGVPPERLVRAETRPVQYPTAPSSEEMFGRQPQRVPEAATEITVEEIVEGIVAEYWTEFEDRLDNFERRDIQLQAQIQDLKKGMGELESRLKTREADMVGKLENMNESMTGIQGRIGSIEKVFKDFLPQMGENVRTMTEAIEKLKTVR